jgi:hypothetical protein
MAPDPITICIIGQLGFAVGFDGVLRVRLICNMDKNGAGARVEKQRTRSTEWLA